MIGELSHGNVQLQLIWGMLLDVLSFLTFTMFIAWLLLFWYAEKKILNVEVS